MHQLLPALVVFFFFFFFFFSFFFVFSLSRDCSFSCFFLLVWQLLPRFGPRQRTQNAIPKVSALPAGCVAQFSPLELQKIRVLPFLGRKCISQFSFSFAFWVYAGARERRFLICFVGAFFFPLFLFFPFFIFSSFFSFFFFFVFFFFLLFLLVFFFLFLSFFSFSFSFSFFFFLFFFFFFFFFFFIVFLVFFGNFCPQKVDDNGHKLSFQRCRLYPRGVWRNFRLWNCKK